MAVKSLVIEADASTVEKAQDAINKALTDFPISQTAFVQAVTIAFQAYNEVATIVIFYDDGS